ncbi:thioredoxin family protein (Thioredoxin_3 domain) [Campylobacter blaseri]|uniref:Thioredoxin family protein n=1 Tax=Campylobacter blaseri TaxID=2042961 RepID=A0A2P8R185_9BACT|nr:thioredoxin family protein [Campylobacter blaseri]PSM52260.1 thioredoxin family protein [Campylobacter blaseri]PSM54026.1 thioredoxin family protein [Campylobacter blaseri]QKF85464.1 thioredoxin family protein (Thioredoxin_3 domain) [Campylobacter blaseri]
MKLFSMFKKKSLSKENLDKNSSFSTSNVKILGTGCAKCNELEKLTTQSLKELNINTNVKHIKDLFEISKYGVMSTPALVINEKVVTCGQIYKKEKLKEIIKANL